MRICHMVIGGCLGLQYISTLSHKRQDFRKKMLLNVKCVLRLSLQIVSETFLILRRNERDIRKNIYWYSRKVPVTLVKF
jgi:hypothetical protein